MAGTIVRMLIPWLSYIFLTFILRSVSSIAWYIVFDSLFAVCPGVSHLNNLTSDPAICYLDYSCSLLNCCVSVEKIDRSMSVQIKLDPCSQKMTVNLERISIEVDLLTFDFGRQHFFKSLLIAFCVCFLLLIYDLMFTTSRYV